jgi:hypothetical protein
MGTGSGTGNLIGAVRGMGAKIGFGVGRSGATVLLVVRVGRTGNRFVGGIVNEVGSNDGASERFRLGLRIGRLPHYLSCQEQSLLLGWQVCATNIVSSMSEHDPLSHLYGTRYWVTS